MNKRIYILLPVHNRCGITRHFIECLKNQTHENFHLVLIDDGSDDGTEEMVRRNMRSLSVIKGNGDWWWAGALQQGYWWLKKHKVSGYDLVLLINDDTEVEPDFLQTGCDLMAENPDALLQAECYDMHTRGFLISGIHADWRYLKFNPALHKDDINCLSTRGLFLSVKSFFKIGGFYPRLLPHYASDYEFTMRAYNKGFKLRTDPRLRLWVNKESTGFNNFKSNHLFVAIRKIFSKKTAINPLTWTLFIFLSCPFQWKMINMFRVWLNMFILVGFILSNDLKGIRYLPLINTGHTSILRNITKRIRCMAGIIHLKCYARYSSDIRIVVGASGSRYKGWVRTEKEFLNIIVERNWKRVFKENSIDAILAEHVWEHLTLEEGLIAAKNCFKYLKHGGYIRAAVPDGYHPDMEYVERVKAFGTGPGADDLKILFNHETFERLFKIAGFDVISLEYYGSDRQFHYTHWEPSKGVVRRSRNFDDRNKYGKLNYTSIIIDAIKN